MSADWLYQCLLSEILAMGTPVESRNHPCVSHHDLTPVTFSETPLITVRKTAWRKAILEMEWFLSGDPRCPEELMDWWAGQLHPTQQYRRGYGEQWRKSTGDFDQIHYILDGIRNHPTSRRLVMSNWNPYEMAHITSINNNPKCPTCCHHSLTQFFVRNGELSMTVYQRSADMLLGFSHNIIQSWALLMWFAHQTDLQVGHLRWLLGDAHIYAHPSHIETAEAIIKARIIFNPNPPVLQYRPEPGEEEFKASDFEIIGDAPEPLVNTRPVLL